jgi:apolipoprotein N-acyltransferase
MIFPAAFVALEFLRSRNPSAATWGSIAYTQYGFLPIMQIAAVAGIWGITFAITWTASTLELAWRQGFDSTRTPVVVCVVVMMSLVLAGATRVAFAGTETPSLRAATLNRPVDLFIPGEMTRITEGRVAPDDLPQVREKLTRRRTNPS